MNLQLTAAELSLLVQSLKHCLSTCKHAAEQGKDHPCDSCDAGRALLAKIEGALKQASSQGA